MPFCKCPSEPEPVMTRKIDFPTRRQQYFVNNLAAGSIHNQEHNRRVTSRKSTLTLRMAPKKAKMSEEAEKVEKEKAEAKEEDEEEEEDEEDLDGSSSDDSDEEIMVSTHPIFTRTSKHVNDVF